jgi:hypothetical protein
MAHRNDAPTIRGKAYPPRARPDGRGAWLTADLIAAPATQPSAPEPPEVDDLATPLINVMLARHKPGRSNRTQTSKEPT